MWMHRGRPARNGRGCRMRQIAEWKRYAKMCVSSQALAPACTDVCYNMDLHTRAHTHTLANYRAPGLAFERPLCGCSVAAAVWRRLCCFTLLMEQNTRCPSESRPTSERGKSACKKDTHSVRDGFQLYCGQEPPGCGVLQNTVSTATALVGSCVASKSGATPQLHQSMTPFLSIAGSRGRVAERCGKSQGDRFWARTCGAVPRSTAFCRRLRGRVRLLVTRRISHGCAPLPPPTSSNNTREPDRKPLCNNVIR